MKEIYIDPSEVLTTTDFPVYSNHILKIYYRIAKYDSELLPPTPVLSVVSGIPYLNSKDDAAKIFNEKMKKFFDKNVNVKYIMCDGSHKTTALFLNKKKIKAMLLESDDDVVDFHKLEEKGDIFSFASSWSIDEILQNKGEHFCAANFFETVKDKTLRMISEKVIPAYMINNYKR